MDLSRLLTVDRQCRCSNGVSAKNGTIQQHQQLADKVWHHCHHHTNKTHAHHVQNILYNQTVLTKKHIPPIQRSSRAIAVFFFWQPNKFIKCINSIHLLITMHTMCTITAKWKKKKDEEEENCTKPLLWIYIIENLNGLETNRWFLIFFCFDPYCYHLWCFVFWSSEMPNENLPHAVYSCDPCVCLCDGVFKFFWNPISLPIYSAYST